MLIKQIKGYELEKAKPNSPEDLFNRSEVTFAVNGEEKTFHLLYLRYFDELMPEFTPFANDPLFDINGADITFKDIVGFVVLQAHPEYVKRKRVYINDKKELAACFEKVNVSQLKEAVAQIQQGGYKIDLTISA